MPIISHESLGVFGIPCQWTCSEKWPLLGSCHPRFAVTIEGLMYISANPAHIHVYERDVEKRIWTQLNCNNLIALET